MAERMKDPRPVYLGDDLFACQPIREAVLSIGSDFLVTAKPESHIALYDFMNGAEFDERSCARRCLVERPSHACVPTSSKKSGRSSRYSAAR
jgi:hypothetical protein